jgi:uncharacterized protein (TIGR03067 family)
MKHLINLVLLVVISAALGADQGEDMNKELKALEGTWKAVAMEAGGQPLPKESLPPFTFIVGAGGKSVAKMAEGEEQATISVDPTKSPRTIDNLHESGATKGKTQYGIYKLEGDKWTVCMTRPGVSPDDRPKTFDTTGTANVLFVFERQKQDKQP